MPFNDDNEVTENSTNPNKRYLLCPAGLRIKVLKKFISLKYDLDKSVLVEFLFKHESLDDDLRLMDLAYIYSRRMVSKIIFLINNTNFEF